MSFASKVKGRLGNVVTGCLAAIYNGLEKFLQERAKISYNVSVEALKEASKKGPHLASFRAGLLVTRAVVALGRGRPSHAESILKAIQEANIPVEVKTEANGTKPMYLRVKARVARNAKEEDPRSLYSTSVMALNAASKESPYLGSFCAGFWSELAIVCLKVEKQLEAEYILKALEESSVPNEVKAEMRDRKIAFLRAEQCYAEPTDPDILQLE